MSSVLFCFFYACSDEIHQLFVSARSGRVLDVFIDTCGACLGNGIVLLLKKYKIWEHSSQLAQKE